ncbi:MULTISPECIES: DUF397 domain-containing protein [Streptomyces]|uniref:DUF397 domain-containing protein n=3 Tax=Streptomyces TaxID=1883 RepID=A0A7U9DSE3_STRLI|nr:MULTISPECIES: DUF397 domain-containing protein [Streptomyces]QSJ09887.1 hypothetical protein SLIVDG2_16895 [Streptomyces lividans]AIJ14353.1 hypothetical protein SLIV_16895 [Streptomyces lividans TK24]EFD67752.1 conserved hypothetical protein [Streptomyces lividans TK24]EOY49246.1 hypothetical protein SLI_4537 [Streptomyces lividans 1326]KKD13142.1 toxin [Streptomyces sp. WM6391]
METTPEYDWYKSSYSGGSGDNCLEVARWRKSTHSGGSGGNCLEVATGNTAVPVRDSKNPVGPTLRFQADAWTAFVESLRRGGVSGPGGR